MILILQGVETNSIILTLDGLAYIPVLYVKDDANRKAYEIPLGDDVSTFPVRFNKFIVDNSHFAGLDEGYYNYTVKEFGTGLIIEQGKLYIEPTAKPQIPAAATPGDDILILN